MMDTNFSTNEWGVHNSSSVDLVTSDNSSRNATMEDFKLYWAAHYINRYYLWVIFAIGFPGNLASFITILRMPPLTSSTAYVAVMSLIDNLAIILKLLLHQLTNYDIDLGVGGCRVVYYFGSFSVMFVNWILVAMTIERFVAIWFPFQVGTYCNGRKAGTIMGIIAFILLLANLQFLWTKTDIVRDKGDVDCVTHEDYRTFIELYWYWIDGALYAIIPCILLFVFNFLIIFGIRRSSKTHKDLIAGESDRMVDKLRQQRQITIMLVVVSIVFVVLIIPNCLFYIITPYWKYTPNTYGHAKNVFTKQIIFMLSDSNHAVNFYLYFLSGKRFRSRFFDIMLCRKIVRRPFTRVTITSETSFSSSMNTHQSKKRILTT